MKAIVLNDLILGSMEHHRNRNSSLCNTIPPSLFCCMFLWRQYLYTAVTIKVMCNLRSSLFIFSCRMFNNWETSWRLA